MTLDLDAAALQQRLAEHVSATRAGAAREAQLGRAITEAITLIDRIVGLRQVPRAIIERAVIECGAELVWRQLARSGVMTFESEGALETVRIGLDPTRSARAILAPWLGSPIA